MKRFLALVVVGFCTLVASLVSAGEVCTTLNLHTDNIGLICGNSIYAFPKSDVVKVSPKDRRVVAIVSGEVKTFYLKKTK